MLYSDPALDGIQLPVSGLSPVTEPIIAVNVPASCCEPRRDHTASRRCAPTSDPYLCGFRSAAVQNVRICLHKSISPNESKVSRLSEEIHRESVWEVTLSADRNLHNPSTSAVHSQANYPLSLPGTVLIPIMPFVSTRVINVVFIFTAWTSVD